MVWGYGDGWCRVVWEVVVREVGLRVEVSITRGSACEGSACPSAEASLVSAGSGLDARQHTECSRDECAHRLG